MTVEAAVGGKGPNPGNPVRLEQRSREALVPVVGAAGAAPANAASRWSDSFVSCTTT